jgi:hypothetical protein
MKWRVWGACRRFLVLGMACAGSGLLLLSGATVASASSLKTTSYRHLNKITTVASTVPGNGDINPYGVVVVPQTTGKLVRGDILVSNFNNKKNLQGTGTTIVQISPDGNLHLFAHISPSSLHGSCPGGVGLTTALAIVHGDWVIVGSLPTTDGTSATAKAGCLIVVNRFGNAVETFAGHGINGPWDMTSIDRSNDDSLLFVTNVLNGTVAANGNIVHKGTVLRLDLEVSDSTMPHLSSITVIGSGFSERTDPAALVIGPTGVGLGANDTLYVADSVNNRIASIADASDRNSSALAGHTVTSNGSLNDPLGLTIAPNGNILVVNGNDGNLVEITPHGNQIAKITLDSTGNPPGAGTLFGLAVAPEGIYFVDDGSNTLNLLDANSIH